MENSINFFFLKSSLLVQVGNTLGISKAKARLSQG